MHDALDVQSGRAPILDRRARASSHACALGEAVGELACGPIASVALSARRRTAGPAAGRLARTAKEVPDAGTIGAMAKHVVIDLPTQAYPVL
jgi:hypothetical protein